MRRFLNLLGIFAQLTDNWLFPATQRDLYRGIKAIAERNPGFLPGMSFSETGHSPQLSDFFFQAQAWRQITFSGSEFSIEPGRLKPLFEWYRRDGRFSSEELAIIETEGDYLERKLRRLPAAKAA